MTEDSILEAEGEVTVSVDRKWTNLICEILIAHQSLLALITCTSLIIITFVTVMFRKIKYKVPDVKELVGVGSTKPRFRKRDKVMFYGRKIIRKVRSMSGQVRGERRIKKRQIVIKFAKRLLRLRKETMPLQLQVKEPSAAYLEADMTEHAERLPPEVMYMLKSIRVFGQFEKPLFLELCKHLESRFLPSGQFLFRIGDIDDSIYVVQSGKLNVFISESDGSELPLKYVTVGESVTSLLSFIDVLTGEPSFYKTVSARAVEDTIILRLPLYAFQDVFERYPESLVRVVQVIMVRLQRVSFTALYHYMGLTSQLINPGSQVQRKISAPAMPHSPKTSPIKNKEWRQGSICDDRQMTSQTECDDAEGSKIRLQDAKEAIKPLPSPTARQLSLPVRKRSRAIGLQDIIDRMNATDGEEVDYLSNAMAGFKVQLGLEDESLLQDRIELRDVSTGSCLIKQESIHDATLIYILAGSLLVSQKLIDKDDEAHLFVAYPGELVGALAVLSGEPSFFTIRARQSSKVAILTKTSFYAIMREYPKMVLHVATSIVKRLSPFVRQIDFSLDWMHVEAGKALYRQGDPADCTYIILSGRLRSVITRSNGKKELVGEYGRGDLVGIVELLAETERSTTVMAVRDTELAKMPEGLLNTIKVKYPVVMYRLMHLLGHGILGSWQKSSLPVDSRPSASNFSTVAIVPVNDVPLHAFTLELFHSLSAIGPTVRLTSDLVKKVLGASILDTAHEYRLSSWLGQQEDHHKIVLYQCDNEVTPWTQRCIRHADVILFIALADQEPSVGKMEKQLEQPAIRTQKELILLHKVEGKKPRNTVQWLNMRSWCSSHHHIRCPKRMFSRRSHAKIMEMYNKLFETEPNIHSDFSRLARFLTGTSIGLVLGGGGARGCAHVGMIRAILEYGIPIDMVGGVSIGSFMGGLWCMEQNLTTFTQKAREWSLKMTSVWRQIIDLTYPSTAMFTGAAFNSMIQEVFRETQIEDLWLPYFAVTTDITDSSMRVHTHGSLWRYVRASMSICGLLPPLCDPEDGHLLVDGAYVDNLPADVMRNQGAHTILAIDVGSQDEADLTNYGDKLSGWWLLMKKWNPWASPIRVPSLPEIQSRLAYVSCVRQLEEVKRSDYCEYIRPPIDRYKTLQFGSFDEIRDVGYTHGKALFSGMQKAGVLPGNVKVEKSQAKTYFQRQVNMTRTRDASFTDLAEMICRIKEPNKNLPMFDEYSDEDEYEDYIREEGYVSEPGALLANDEKNNLSPIRRRRINSLSESELGED